MDIRRKSIFICVLVLLALAVVLWPRKADTALPVVGVIYAATGPASFAGKPEGDVLKYLEDDYLNSPGSGRKFKLEFRDSGGDKDKAIQYLEEFSKDPRCVAIIGPTGSGESIALATRLNELSPEDKLPVLSLAASSLIVKHPDDPTRQNEWVFKFAQNDDLAARKLATVIKSEVGDGTVTFLYSDDGFGKSGAGVFPGEARGKGIKLESQLRSFAADLNAPKATIASIPPDIAGFVIWGSAPGPALLVKAIRESRPNVPIYLSHGNASQDFIDSVGASGDDIVVVGSRVLTPAEQLGADIRDKEIRQFQEFWFRRSGQPQSHFAGHAYDAFQLLRAAFNDGKESRSAIRKHIELTKAYPGITGVFTFSEGDHAGLDVSAFDVFRIRDDRFVPYAAKASNP